MTNDNELVERVAKAIDPEAFKSTAPENRACIKKQRKRAIRRAKAAIAEMQPQLDMMAEMAETLDSMLECPRWLDNATVPKAGIDAAPEQVVFEMSVGFLRIKALEELLREVLAFFDNKIYILERAPKDELSDRYRVEVTKLRGEITKIKAALGE